MERTLEWKLHAFVLIQAGRFGRKIVFATQPSHHCQGKVGFLELWASPLGVRIAPNLVILVHEEKAVAQSRALREGGYKRKAAGGGP
jgi:hypothetical protein